jgi:hypothetical protein
VKRPAQTEGGERKMTPPSATDDANLKSEVVCARATMGPDGGTLSVEGTCTPADGLKAVVPPGALEEEDEISLGYSSGSVKIRAGTGSGIVLFLGAKRAHEFEEPVTLEVPLDASLFSDLAIPYQIDEDGRLHVMDIKQIDQEHLRLRINTFKPCMFTWVYP